MRPQPIPIHDGGPRRRRSSGSAAAVLLAALAAGVAVTTAATAAVPASTGAPPADSPRLVPADAAAVLAAVRGAKARAVVVNVWASWCSPCREEFPDILKVGRDLRDRGVALVLVSGDFDEGRDDALKFLADHGVDFTTYLKTGSDQSFIDGLAPAWSGMLPATMVFDGAGRLRHLEEGKVTYQRLRDLVLQVIDHPTPNGPQKETKR